MGPGPGRGRGRARSPPRTAGGVGTATSPRARRFLPSALRAGRAGPGRTGRGRYLAAWSPSQRPLPGLLRSCPRPRSLPRSVLTALPLPKAARAPPLRRRRHCRGRGADPRPRSVLLPPRRRLTRGAAALGFSLLGSPRRPQDDLGPTGPGAPSLSDRTLPRQSSGVWYSPHCTASAGGRTSQRRGRRRARVTPPPWRDRSRPAPSRHGVAGHGAWNGPLLRARRSPASREQVAVTSEGGSVPVPPPAPSREFPQLPAPCSVRDAPGSAPAPAPVALAERPPSPRGPRRKGATQSCWVEVTK